MEKHVQRVLGVEAIALFLAGRRDRPGSRATLEATQGQILSQSPTDATRFWWRVDSRNHRFAPGLPAGRT